MSQLDVISCVSIAALRALSVADATAVLVLGHYAADDQGGGLFAWTSDTTTPDDNGITIVPSAEERAGCWRRLERRMVSPRWFGAKGDGMADDTAAIQAAIDYVERDIAAYCTGGTVMFSAGRYRVVAPNGGAALWITKNNVAIDSEGASPFGARILVDGPGSGIVIEGGAGYPILNPSIARGSRIGKVHIAAMSPGSMFDGIVVHAHSVRIDEPFIAGSVRHGILIESGEVGQGIIGATQAPLGTQFNVNHWRVEHARFEGCGDRESEGPRPPLGGGLCVHGSDGQAGMAVGCFAYVGNVGYIDESIGGNLYLACYSEGCHLGFRDASAFGSGYYRCNSEDTVPCDLESQGTVVVDGTLASQAGAYKERIGKGNSALDFRRTALDGRTYLASVPGRYASAFDIAMLNAEGKVAGIWGLSYQPTDPHWAFLAQSWRWYTRDKDAQGDPNTRHGDVGTFGWTDLTHPRGASLPFIANPLINTPRRWTHRQQSIVLQPGPNTVYAFGATVDAGSFDFAFDTSQQWPKAQTRVDVSVEYESLEDLQASNVVVSGYVMLPKGDPYIGHRNIAAKLLNASVLPITVTIVWHVEAFVPNYDGFPPG